MDLYESSLFRRQATRGLDTCLLDRRVTRRLNAYHFRICDARRRLNGSRQNRDNRPGRCRVHSRARTPLISASILGTSSAPASSTSSWLASASESG